MCDTTTAGASLGMDDARMAQIFHPSTNTIAKVSILGGVFILAAIVWVIGQLQRSPYITQVNVARAQPVQFSHDHHVGGLGIDCRYCHTSVEDSSYAGMPTTKTCMTCHSQIWTNSALLEPVRASWRSGQPIRWTRVHDLPDFAHFDHGTHVQKGIGCQSCHGRVDEMPLMWQNASLHMEWCLSCHRNPENNVRPRAEVFNMQWQGTEPGQARELVKKYGIAPADQMTNCSVCHY
jgi:hypothetical protein